VVRRRQMVHPDGPIINMQFNILDQCRRSVPKAVGADREGLEVGEPKNKMQERGGGEKGLDHSKQKEPQLTKKKSKGLTQ